MALGTFTGEIIKRTRPRTYEGVVDDLAHDVPAYRIAAARRVSNNSVTAISEREADQIAERKNKLATMFDNLCEKSIRRATKTVSKATYAQACVGAGISAQRSMELRGDDKPAIGLTLNLLNVHGNDTH